MMKFYLTIKTNQLLIHATTWKNLRNITSERNQAQKATDRTTPFTGYSEKGKSLVIEI